MTNNYGVVRYGYEESARIAGTTGFGTLGAEVLGAEPSYPPIPFMPSITTGTGEVIGGSTETETQSWERYPERCDLTFYQGDDVVFSLYIEDPNDPDFVMNDPANWDWAAQIRVIHSYRSTLVNTFSIIDTYTPPVTDPPQTGQTKVTLFLPRTENVYVGKYRWDLFSLSPFDADDFPRPPDVPEPEPWPPTDRIRTWLYGVVTIIPRVTSTDVLPVVPEVVVTTAPGPYGVPFAGPNGRVP